MKNRNWLVVLAVVSAGALIGCEEKKSTPTPPANTPAAAGNTATPPPATTPSETPAAPK